jgi:hypothetical protein
VNDLLITVNDCDNEYCDLGFILLGAFAELQKVTVSFVMSVCPHGTNWLPLDGFSLTLISEYFSSIYRENASFIKI